MTAGTCTRTVADILVTVTGEREDLSAALVHHFTAAGWKSEYLNPISPTSFDEGWRLRCGCVLQTAQEILTAYIVDGRYRSSKPAFRERHPGSAFEVALESHRTRLIAKKI